MNKKTYLLAVILLILDQVSKSIIEIYIELEQSVSVIPNFFSLTAAHNTGGAWSILNNHSAIFILISIVALILLIRYMFRFQKNTRNRIAFALTISGIISNLADRIFLGYVRDFLDFKIFGYDFPIFNLADICIVLGVFLLIVAIIKGEDKNEVSSR